jgi:hypothetical protein
VVQIEGFVALTTSALDFPKSHSII